MEYSAQLSCLGPEDDLEPLLDLLMFKVYRNPSQSAAAAAAAAIRVTISQEAATLEASSLVALSSFAFTDATAPCLMHRLAVTYTGSRSSMSHVFL